MTPNSIACPDALATCPPEFQAPGILAAHMRKDHGVNAGRAMNRAWEAFGQGGDNYVTPSVARRAEADHREQVAAGVPSDDTLNAAVEEAKARGVLDPPASSHLLPPHPRPKRERVVRATRTCACGREIPPTDRHHECSTCRRARADGRVPLRVQEAAMPTKADPAACQICKRLTKKAGVPTKCKRHGGEAKSTSWAGRQARKAEGGFVGAPLSTFAATLTAAIDAEIGPLEARLMKLREARTVAAALGA